MSHKSSLFELLPLSKETEVLRHLSIQDTINPNSKAQRCKLPYLFKNSFHGEGEVQWECVDELEHSQAAEDGGVKSKRGEVPGKMVNGTRKYCAFNMHSNTTEV